MHVTSKLKLKNGDRSDLKAFCHKVFKELLPKVSLKIAVIDLLHLQDILH